MDLKVCISSPQNSICERGRYTVGSVMNCGGVRMYHQLTQSTGAVKRRQGWNQMTNSRMKWCLDGMVRSSIILLASMYIKFLSVIGWVGWGLLKSNRCCERCGLDATELWENNKWALTTDWATAYCRRRAYIGVTSPLKGVLACFFKYSKSSLDFENTL